MPLVSLELPAGVYRNGTKLQSKGRWYDANMVRWRNGRLRPIGGWSQSTATYSGGSSAVSEVGRTMFAWKSNSGTKLLAIGTSEKLFIYSGTSGNPYDATPSGFSGGRENALIGYGYGAGPFNGTSINKTVTATDIYIGSSTTIVSSSTDFTTYFSAPDLIQASGFTNSANNKTYSNSHRITAVSANSMTVDGTLVTTGADGSAGQSITLSKARGYSEDLDTGTDLILNANTWSFDVFGEILILLAQSDGKVYQWNPSNLSAQTDATVVANAPTENKGIIVSKERFLICLGAGGNPKKVQWADQETLTTWTPSATNLAGSFELDTAGEIQVAKKVGDRILVWTNLDCHSLDWVGPPYAFGRSKIGDSCGVISPQSAVSVRGISAWMGDGGFWYYDGTVKPLTCEVNSYIFDDMNSLQKSKVYAVPNQKFNEIWWFYPSGSSEEVDKYVIWNFEENWWSIGTMPRTAFIDSGAFDTPIGLGTDKKLYFHEEDASTSSRADGIGPPSSASDMCLRDRALVRGTTESTETGFVYAETGPFEMGDRIMQGKQLLTDVDAGTNGLRFKFKTQNTPMDTETESSAYSIDDGYTDIRIQGREVSFMVESPFDQNWDLGRMRMDVKALGKR